ncbi:transporter suffix domain-containing protein [Paenibacillus pini]|uniref:transporter suffix domain-containing protein n=1 Tax=Paenibacillus pini TaxID=669461 RepID=UPI000AAF57B1|nr:transporter suffix domain-containing protein [Paenibacillus pini]
MTVKKEEIPITIPTTSTTTPTPKKKSIYFKIGVGLLVVSMLSWLIPVIAPFTPLPTKEKAMIITGAIIFAEVLFWVGTLLVGKEMAKKFKSYFLPKKRSQK